MINALDSIVKGANAKDLPTTEQISQGYRHNGPMAQGDDNPKLFAWQFLYTDYLIEAAKHWHNQVVVDLGCGTRLDGYHIAHLAGAKAYVAVDPYHMSKFYIRLTDDEKSKGDQELNERIQKIRRFIQNRGYDEKVVGRIIKNIDFHFNGKHLPIALVAEDMVSALRRLPRDSVSIMTAGLDKQILSGDGYAELAQKEISRVLHPQGAYLAMCSRFAPKLLSDSSFEGNMFRKFTKV